MRRLKFLRIDRGWSQNDLSPLVHINRSTLTNIENGRVNPTPDELVRLGKVLGCSPERLLDLVSADALGGSAESRSQRETRS